MKIILTILTAILTTMLTVSAQTAPPLETGVSQTLAKWRAANYSDVRYKLNITLEKNAPLMKGTIEVSVKLTETGAKNDLILDWRTTQFQNDKDKPFAEVERVNEQIVKETVPNGVFDYHILKEHILVSKKYLKTGENTLLIKFASPIKTSGAAITRYVDKEDGAEYVYSLFVPSDASTAFPVFDQPDLKARFKLNITTPEDWMLVTNTPFEKWTDESISALKNPKVFNNQNHFDAEETKPISTYVFAFAAGEFKVFEQDLKNKISVSSVKDFRNTKFVSPNGLIYVRKSQAEKFKQHAAEVFRLNREGVKFLEDYFDYKFPFPKYDLVLIPEFPFGGMEHAGATFLRESSVIFPTEPTKNDLVSRANVIFHEAAHQWFGDTVTMKWFDDLWLKEGFAEFMAYKTLGRVMPEYNAWKIFYERNKQAAYLTDSTRGTTPIYQEIPNLSAAKSAYGNIVYRKAPSFLKQAEFYLGEKEFQFAVRKFLKKYEFANAEWTDLVKEFRNQKPKGADGFEKGVSEFSDTWITKGGLKIIRTSFQKSGNLPYRLTHASSSSFSGLEDLPMEFNALAIYEDGTRSVEKIDLILGRQSFIPFHFLKKKPIAIIPNYQDYGYGIFLLDEQSRAYVLANIQTEKDDFMRTMMWGSLWDSVREAELAPQDYVELVIKNINVETDESTIQTLLNRVSTAMNYYLSDKERIALAPKVEAIAFGGMTSAKTAGLRITFFRAYLNIASTDNARVWLKKILESDGKPIENPFFRGAITTLQEIPPLAMPPLKTKDKFDIVTKLLILENRRRIIGKFDSEELLAELEKTEKSDEAKRYAYAAKAGIGKANNKEKYWNDFVDNKDLSESWIESAFVVFNAPQHSDLTLPYLEKALAELPNLKKNRKIFFVNGWLAAFIGGQKSAEALQIVNKFLADNPNLDKDLRLKILENADGLERAVKIREKYGK